MSSSLAAGGLQQAYNTRGHLRFRYGYEHSVGINQDDRQVWCYTGDDRGSYICFEDGAGTCNVSLQSSRLHQTIFSGHIFLFASVTLVCSSDHPEASYWLVSRHRALVWPICVAGCMASTVDDQAFFRSTIESAKNDSKSFGNSSITHLLLELSWTLQRERGYPVDCTTTIKEFQTDGGILLVWYCEWSYWSTFTSTAFRIIPWYLYSTTAMLQMSDCLIIVVHYHISMYHVQIEDWMVGGREWFENGSWTRTHIWLVMIPDSPPTCATDVRTSI